VRPTESARNRAIRDELDSNFDAADASLAAVGRNTAAAASSDRASASAWRGEHTYIASPAPSPLSSALRGGPRHGREDGPQKEEQAQRSREQDRRLGESVSRLRVSAGTEDVLDLLNSGAQAEDNAGSISAGLRQRRTTVDVRNSDDAVSMVNSALEMEQHDWSMSAADEATKQVKSV